MLRWFLLCAAAAFAQPTFDVASVKTAAGTRTGGYTHQTTPTGFTALHVSMGHLLRYAWDIRTAYELVGPSWLDAPTEQEYDVVAKTASPVREEEIRLMVRTLLQERFHLQAHRERRELPAYLLVARKPSLRPAAQIGDPQMRSGDAPYSERFLSFTMAQFARQLGPPWTSRPVVDGTGLDGAYDFSLDIGRYVLDDSGKSVLDYRGAIDMEGALLRALPDQLGLVLRPQRAPYEVLVVERVDKVPVGN